MEYWYHYYSFLKYFDYNNLNFDLFGHLFPLIFKIFIILHMSFDDSLNLNNYLNLCLGN